MNFKILFCCLFLLIIGCNTSKDTEEKKAKELADKIINKLNSEEVKPFFSEEFFSDEEINKLITDCNLCGWQDRKGGFIQKDNLIVDGELRAAFIYEFNLPECNDVKMTLIFDLQSDEPVLRKIRLDSK